MRLHAAPSPARWPARRFLALLGALGLLGCGPEVDRCTPELCSSHCCRENICEPAETCSTPVTIPVPDAGVPDAAITRVSGTYLSNESPRTTTSGFRAVTGTSSSDLWAIGGDLIYHSSGFGQWTEVPSNAPGVTLRSVWASSPTNAWAVGYSGVMLHWNGTAWSRAPNVVGGALLGIHGTSASNVWAVGVDGVVLHRR